MMKFAGLNKCTLLDFPKTMAAVLFTQGCSFRCHYCHNPSLVDPEQFSDHSYSEKELLLFLEKRRAQLQGVVISGGEPLMHPEIIPFIKEVKALGYRIKIDTSGYFPKRLQQLLDEKYIDYIAMDIKAPLQKYHSIVGITCDTKKILTSIDLITSSDCDYEFRSTILPALHTQEDIMAMGRMIKGAKQYILQNFRPMTTLNDAYTTESSFSMQKLEYFQQKLHTFVQSCHIR
jgi:pyruvate formate lyase activating enzyme